MNLMMEIRLRNRLVEMSGEVDYDESDYANQIEEQVGGDERDVNVGEESIGELETEDEDDFAELEYGYEKEVVMGAAAEADDGKLLSLFLLHFFSCSIFKKQTPATLSLMLVDIKARCLLGRIT